MSTRCNVIVIDIKRDKKTYIYHHHDGYPSGVGAELQDIILTYCSDNNVINAAEVSLTILDHDPEYEMTRYIHGDIEYLYSLKVDDTSISYMCYKIKDWNKETDDPENWASVESKIFTSNVKSGTETEN